MENGWTSASRVGSGTGCLTFSQGALLSRLKVQFLDLLGKELESDAPRPPAVRADLAAVQHLSQHHPGTAGPPGRGGVSRAAPDRRLRLSAAGRGWGHQR